MVLQITQLKYLNKNTPETIIKHVNDNMREIKVLFKTKNMNLSKKSTR